MMGTDENVNVTVTLREGVRNTIEIISHWFEVPEHQACLLLSAAVDFDVTQAVDLVAGAHGLIDSRNSRLGFSNGRKAEPVRSYPNV
ncbi:hypothetical protein [Bifidobacterium sp.]|jgi:acetamidase/formamidase|uniref:hypothetical protein n=1 Tax=Bifidobacterium sp. TaxID=41200 RepID=UPI0025C41545|nr:hypothetical protein [Bifidobacterium sp.]MCH4210023.1 hypothetical protein [Bifidobacterium sp.]MCI1225413.1 hypothetical protein [Bifidobacterium sp.]